MLATLESPIDTNPAPPLSPRVWTPRGQPEDRRGARRMDRDELSGDIRLTIPGFSKIVMVNISETGALIETSRPLNPGMMASLFVRLNGQRHALRVTTVRSRLHAITPKSGVVYRTALHFDRRLPLEARLPWLS